MTAPLDIRLEEDHDGGVTARVSGEIDLANAERLRHALHAEAGTAKPIRLDLSDVSYVDSAGIAVLFDRAAQGELEVRCRRNSVVASLIAITRLGDVASITTED